MNFESLLQQAEKVVTLLKENGKMIATAESCTGGMLSALLVSVPGASSVFECGITAYSARTKAQLLGVKAETLEAHGTVSRQTAAEMAIGIRRVAAADIGLSVTGVAGPDPSEGKDPGTVYVALADGKNVRIQKLVLNPESRNQVRRAACYEILRMVEEHLISDPVQ